MGFLGGVAFVLTMAKLIIDSHNRQRKQENGGGEEAMGEGGCIGSSFHSSVRQ